jgi:heme exporter protein A
MPGNAIARNECCAIWFGAERLSVSRPPLNPQNGGLRISFSNIEKRFGMRMALRGISLEINAGECVALVGHNGSGKTTLLRIAAQLLRPSRGETKFYSGMTAMNPMDVKRRVGVVAHQALVYDELTAEENLVFFAKLYALPEPVARARKSLESVGLRARSGDMVRTFSRGMRQRLAIARALLASPQLLLLDEPAAGLDPEGQQWLGTTLAQLHSSGCTILMSTHGRNETQASVTRAIRLEGGVVTHDSGMCGDPDGVLALTSARERAEGNAG